MYKKRRFGRLSKAPSSIIVTGFLEKSITTRDDANSVSFRMTDTEFRVYLRASEGHSNEAEMSLICALVQLVAIIQL